MASEREKLEKRSREATPEGRQAREALQVMDRAPKGEEGPRGNGADFFESCGWLGNCIQCVVCLPLYYIPTIICTSIFSCGCCTGETCHDISLCVNACGDHAGHCCDCCE